VAAEVEAARVAAEAAAVAQAAADQVAADQAAEDARLAAEEPATTEAVSGYNAEVARVQDLLGLDRLPSSGEMQFVYGCDEGYIPASECAASGLPGGGPEQELCYPDSQGNCHATQVEADEFSQRWARIATAEECLFLVDGQCSGSPDGN
jgi:hypothetical protein